MLGFCVLSFDSLRVDLLDIAFAAFSTVLITVNFQFNR